MYVTRLEQRAYIKIAVLRGRIAIECHSELVEAVGNNALPNRDVARWAAAVKRGRATCGDLGCSGRPVSVQSVSETRLATSRQFCKKVEGQMLTECRGLRRRQDRTGKNKGEKKTFYSYFNQFSAYDLITRHAVVAESLGLIASCCSSGLTQNL